MFQELKLTNFMGEGNMKITNKGVSKSNGVGVSKNLIDRIQVAIREIDWVVPPPLASQVCS